MFDAKPGESQNSTVVDEKAPFFPTIEEPPASPPKKPDGGQDKDIGPTSLDVAPDDPDKPSPPSSVNFAVFYTKAALEKAGGTAAINALINGSISSLQESFLTSHINITVDATYRGLLDYIETGNIEADRDALQAHTLASVSNIPQLKKNAKANIVALIVENSGSYCGISYIPEVPGTDYSDFSYIVVARKCAVDNLSFAHETGHILGARHDKYVDPTEGMPLGKNHGVVFKCGDSFCRDIMGYNNYCQDILHVQCARIAAWSGKIWSMGSPIQESIDDVE